MNKLGFFSITFFSLLAGVTMLKARTSHESIKSALETKNGESRFVQGPVTIYLHGTHLNAIIPIGGISRHAKALEERIHGGPKGLHPVIDIDEKYYVRTIGMILNSVDPKEYPLENFYSFVWSGQLDARKRHKEAHALYSQIMDRIVKPYEKAYGVPPIIRIITHSHGGNVALQLARVGHKKSHGFTVDQLILLACPVQKETSKYISDPMFKQVFNIHSHDDMIQILYMQKFHPLHPALVQAWNEKTMDPIKCAFWECVDRPFFSERHFVGNPNLRQVRVEWNGKPHWNPEDTDLFGIATMHKITRPIDRSNRGLMHIEFIIPTFFHNLPKIIDAANKENTQDDIVFKM